MAAGVRRGWAVTVVPAALLLALLAWPGAEAPGPVLPSEVPAQVEQPHRPDAPPRGRARVPVNRTAPAPVPVVTPGAPTAGPATPAAAPASPTQAPSPAEETPSPTLSDCVRHLLTAPLDC